MHADLALDPRVRADTRLWAARQNTRGGPGGGCVDDVDEIVKRLGPL